MERVEHFVTIDRPVGRVFRQWTQYEDFPRLVRGVQEVRQLDDRYLLCRLGLGNAVAVELTFEVTELVRDDRISWRSIGGWPSAGTVRFESRDDGPFPHTQVRLILAWDAPRVSFGLVDARAFEALERLKLHLETRDVATGAWQGNDADAAAMRRAPPF